jgi:mannose-6-phosphate isomerase
MKLGRRYVEKPWGRTTLPPMFDPPAAERIGEVWFTGGDDLPLLLKYLFTSERLSVQVHPDDAYARAHGLPHGKSECWYVLDAEPDAAIALGLVQEVSKEQLRAAALDGSIEHLMDWKPVRSRDFFFVPPGTIHAIGDGITLLEFQQNIDLTYRLYDYGRPRELHLDDGIAVATPSPYPAQLAQHLTGSETRTLVDGPHFTLVHTTEDMLSDRQRWIIPIEGDVRSGGDTAGAGDCLLLEAGERLETNGSRVLIGARA